MRQEIFEQIKKVVIECGDIVLNADYDELGIENKEGNNNIVTKYDVMVQDKLKSELLSIIPAADFVGEENNALECGNKEYRFIVDPIDGTTNFSRNIKMCAISVAVLKDGNVIAGVCYNPYLKELYEAQEGKGAYLNGRRIHVSNRELKNGIVLCGCAPYYDDLREKSLVIQKKLSLVAGDFRRFGSAVIEICNIACGRAEVYFELKLMPWDYAAASLILTEAGGRITDINGKKLQFDNSTSLVASNGVEDYLEYIL